MSKLHSLSNLQVDVLRRLQDGDTLSRVKNGSRRKGDTFRWYDRDGSPKDMAFRLSPQSLENLAALGLVAEEHGVLRVQPPVPGSKVTLTEKGERLYLLLANTDAIRA